VKIRPARKITHRVSSVTNGFVQAILPDEKPDERDLAAVLTILEIDPERLTCAYCGDPAQHWDHLFPYVRDKRPSGFLNEARNLVPACGPCNTSKSGRDWKSWMFGSAKGSPATRRIADLCLRAERIEGMVTAFNLQPMDLAGFVGRELWQSYWDRLDNIERLLFEAQAQAERIKSQIALGLADRS